MKRSIITTVLLFLELIVLVIIGTNGIWGISEVGERNIYLIFAVFIWVFGTIVLKKVSSNFLRPTMLILGLLVLTSQVQVPRDLLPLKVAGGLLVNQAILYVVLWRYGKFPKILEYFMDVINIGLLLWVWQAFNKGNTDFRFVFSKALIVKSIVPTLGILLSYFIVNKLANIRIFRKLLFFVAVLGIIGVSFTATLPYDRHHHNYFLGPLVKVASGGTMLVDTYSQYGAGLFYFLVASLKLVPLGVTYVGLSFVTSFFEVFSFLGLFALCYFVFRKNLSMAILTTALAILAQLYLGLGVPAAFPSTGFFRFGLAYILAASFVMAKKHLKGFPGQVYAALIVGISAIWSLDTFTSTLYVFGAIQLIDFLENKSVSRIIRAFVILGVLTVLIVGMFTLFTFLRSGFLPNVIPYLAFLKLYSDGFGLLPIPAFGVWWLFLGVYTASAFWSCYVLMFSKNDRDSDLARAALLVTAVGIGILPYYVGRSHSNNLYHVSLPLIFLIGFWIWKNRYIRIAGVILLSFLVASIINLKTDSIKEKFATTILGLPQGTVIQAMATSASVDKEYWYTKLPALKDMDLRKVRYVSTLLPYDRTTGILSLIKKESLTTDGDPDQDSLIWPALRSSIMEQAGKMHAGDLYIGFYDGCLLSGNKAQLQEVYRKLANSYDYKELARFENLTILEVVGPRTNSRLLEGFPDSQKLPIFYSVNPSLLKRTGNLENKLSVQIAGDNLTPTTMVNIGSSVFHTDYTDINHISVEIPELVLNRSGLYKVNLGNCVGISNTLSFTVL